LKSLLSGAVAMLAAAVVAPIARADQIPLTYLTTQKDPITDGFEDGLRRHLFDEYPGVPAEDLLDALHQATGALDAGLSAFGPVIPVALFPRLGHLGPRVIGGPLELDLSGNRIAVGTDGAPIDMGAVLNLGFHFDVPADLQGEFSVTSDMFASDVTQLALNIQNVALSVTSFATATNFTIIPMLGISAFDGEQFLDAWAALVFQDAALNFALNAGEDVTIDVLDFWIALQEALDTQGLGVGNPDYTMSFIVMQNETAATETTTELAILQGQFFDTPDTSDLALTRSSTSPAFLQSAPTFDAPAPSFAFNVPAPPALSVFLVGLIGLAGLQRRMRTA
tara:strand:- start:492 stop:1502 length:1011 start_codon:yes stop_codon:yes gene_type:complete